MKKKIYLNAFILAMLGCVLFVSCSKDDDKKNNGKNDKNQLVVTGAVTEKADTWAIVEGYVNNTDDEGNVTVSVAEYGIEYNEEGNETAKKVAGKGLADSQFSVKLTGLNAKTSYQYRAYVNRGTKSVPDYQYGMYKKFTTEKGSGEPSDPNVLDISSGEVTATGVLFDGLYYIFDGSKATIVKADPELTSVKLPLKVKHSGTVYDLTAIGDKAFQGCDKLTSIDLTYAITSIGAGAFGACTSLETITLPASLKEIKANTFLNCTKLKSIAFPTTLEKIGDYAFYESGLTSVSFPSNLTELGKLSFTRTKIEILSLSSKLKEIPEKAFFECTKLKKLYIGSPIKKLGEACFCFCYNIEEIELPTTLEEIGGSCFQDVQNKLEFLFIPKSVTTIGSGAFMRCYKLSRVDISYGIKSINSYAFYDTPKNITMQITASTPPTLGTEVFREINKYDNQRTLMVPASYLSAYSSNSTYKSYFNTIKASQ